MMQWVVGGSDGQNKKTRSTTLFCCDPVFFHPHFFVSPPLRAYAQTPSYTHAQVLEANLHDQQYRASSVHEWTNAICSQTVGALRGISGSFKYTGARAHARAFPDCFVLRCRNNNPAPVFLAISFTPSPRPLYLYRTLFETKNSHMRADAENGRRASHQLSGVLGAL